MVELPPIVIVGPGRLGRTLHAALAARGHVARLCARGEPVPAAALTLLTVPDRVIAEVAAGVPPGGILLHCSGATGVEVLRPHSPAGSLHPLMTFLGPEAGPLPSRVPAAVAGDPLAMEAATALCLALGWTPFAVPGDRRLYHAAAVMAGNFATVLLAEASAVLAAAGVPEAMAPALLAPLALASIENAAKAGPRQALTGPVARGDEDVIAGHLDALTEIGGELVRTYTVLLGAARRLVRS